MLRLLLAEHLSPDIASAVQALRPEISVVSIHDWDGGQYIGLEDRVILARAHEQGLTLVTYDQTTIPPLLVQWGQAGIPHAGVIFGSSHTIPTSDLGASARVLVRTWQENGDLDLTNRIAYLIRA